MKNYLITTLLAVISCNNSMPKTEDYYLKIPLKKIISNFEQYKSLELERVISISDSVCYSSFYSFVTKMKENINSECKFFSDKNNYYFRINSPFKNKIVIKRIHEDSNFVYLSFDPYTHLLYDKK